MKVVAFLAVLAEAAALRRRASELLSREETEAMGYIWRGNASEKSSHDVLGLLPHWKHFPTHAASKDFPEAFNWCDMNGTSYCTSTLNQHIPQYCGSCWAHGSVSALGDRIKIARNAKGTDINLAVQHILNCNGGGSCHGGSVDGPYQWLERLSAKGSGLSYTSANPYMACSSEMTSGICVAGNWTCEPINIARTCSTFPENGGTCSAIDPYPMVQINDYGSISGAPAMQKEIYNRGPIACGIDAEPILDYSTGIATDHGKMTDHVVSVVGWGYDDESATNYWLVRNSWGEYWGELGYVRVAFGALRLESQCAWAVPSYYTAPELDNQVHCYEDGSACVDDDGNEVQPNGQPNRFGPFANAKTM